MRILILLALAVAACAAQPSASIKERLQGFVQKGDYAGMVAMYTCNGKTWGPEAVGWQDVEAKKPMRTDSIFQVMSMTKPVTAVGIMMLAEQGLLSLGDPIERHLPEFKGVNKNGRPPLIRDLMTHTSGMMANPPSGMDDFYQKLDRTLAEAVSMYSQRPVEFEPGTRWMYSNPGIATLGRIIEVKSGMRYEDFVAERIFRPLGMKDSFFYAPDNKKDRIALVYTRDGAAGRLHRAPGSILGGDAGAFRKGAKYPAPEFGLYSTAADLNLFYQAMLKGKLLSKESMRVMTQVHTGDIPAGWLKGTGYGLGWEVVKDPLGTLTLLSLGTYFHGGAFGTFGWVDTPKQMTGVFMVQTAGPAGDAARDTFLQMANSSCEP